MLRFMPVGDSMTIGSAGEHTWRYRMWQHLRATYGAPFQLVGPRETLYDKATGAADSHEYADLDPAFPRAHLAGWGAGWYHLSPLIADAVRASRADVLLVSLGLIDLGFYTNASQTTENVRAFIARARTANPGISLVLLPVIPNVREEDRRALRRGGRPLQRAPREDGGGPVRTVLPAPPGLRPAHVRHPPGHVRRHAPERLRRTQAGGGVRGGDAPGVGRGRNVHGRKRLTPPVRITACPGHRAYRCTARSYSSEGDRGGAPR